MEINKVFISLGSNLGNRIGNLLSAKFEIINQIGEIIKESRIYESEPWGFKSQPTFLNQVIIIKSLFNANDILKKCKDIHPNLPVFLIKYNFSKAWNGIIAAPSGAHFVKQFHRWFDAFKTFKLLKIFS